MNGLRKSFWRIFGGLNTSICSLVAGISIAISQSGSLRADQVAPIGFDSSAGNTFDFFPMDYGPSSTRYQQVYNSNQFPTFGTGLFISQIGFRFSSSSVGRYNLSLASLQLGLGTTSTAADGLSHTFAANVPAGEQTVFNGAWSVSGQVATGAVKPFDVWVILQTPYFYNPAAGNLLLDLRSSGATSSIFSADVQSAVDGVSRVFSSGVNSTTGLSDTKGAITKFVTAAYGGDWTNGASNGLWSDGGNWSSGNAPIAAVDAIFNTNSLKTVTINAPAVARNLFIQTDNVALDLGNSQLALSADFRVADTSGQSGKLTVSGSGGTASATNISFGGTTSAAGGAAIVTLGTGATLSTPATPTFGPQVPVKEPLPSSLPAERSRQEIF